MKERIRMLSEYDTGNWSISDSVPSLWHMPGHVFSMSGASGVKAIRRRWLPVDHSHAPLHCPHQTEAAVSEAVILLRRRFLDGVNAQAAGWSWSVQAPETCWPAVASTIGDILQRAGG